MCTISLEFQSPTSIIIHNQCLSIELISTVYFSNGAVCPKLSDQLLDVKTAMKILFEINTTQDEFEGALLYKLQRNLRDQYSMDTLATRDNENEAKYVYMLLTWEVKDSKPFVHVVLVEHTNKFIWNEDRLKKLYYGNRGRIEKYNDTISDTWLMDDSMVLKTTSKVRGLKGNFELTISISEEERNDYAIRPLCVDLKRQVALEIQSFMYSFVSSVLFYNHQYH
jgi:hypothetical protein